MRSFAGGAAGLAIALLTARFLAGFQPFGLPLRQVSRIELALSSGVLSGDGPLAGFSRGLSRGSRRRGDSG